MDHQHHLSKATRGGGTRLVQSSKSFPLVVLERIVFVSPIRSLFEIPHSLHFDTAMANVGCATIGWLHFCGKLVWMRWWAINVAIREMVGLLESELTLGDAILVHYVFVGHDGPSPHGIMICLIG